MTQTLAEAQRQGIAPWKNTDIVVKTRHFVVYWDGYPVTLGHTLFVPVTNTWQDVTECWQAAYRWGYEWQNNGFCDAFNLGMNVGEAAGQTVMYPHVHLIPRRKSDCEHPAGGVRHCIPHDNDYYNQ